MAPVAHWRPATDAVAPGDATLRRIAQALGQRPGAVPLRTGAAADRLCEALGTPALALDGAVWLGAGWRRSGPWRRRAILAHEMAHAAQQRAFRDGAPPADPARAEAEAHACAAAALAGRTLRPRLALDPARPACWAEAGHYYTVYFVLLAAGVPNRKALRAAFHCQMSDEIADLDAAERGIEIGLNKDVYDLFGDDGAVSKTRRMLEKGGNTYDGRALTAYDKDPYGTYLIAPRTYRYERGGYDRDIFMAVKVQMGLHSLTGGAAEAETAKRVKIAMEADPEDGPAFGLALHALGDSFAHRDGNRMFPPPLGHGLKFHEPDEIGPARARLYARYVRLLHGIGMRKFNGREGSPILDGCRLDADATIGSLSKHMLHEFKHFSEGMQIAAIRRAAILDLKLTMDPYAPEKTDSQPYDDFARLKMPVTVSIHDLRTALELAETWSRAAAGAGAGDDEALLQPYPIRL